LRIGLLNNLRAGRNDAQVESLLGFLRRHPDVLHAETNSAEVVPEALADLARQEVDLLVVNGGDGTLQCALTEILENQAFDGRIPMIAPLRGGRTNMSAGDLGADKDAVRGFAALLDDIESGNLNHRISPRPVLRVRHGIERQAHYGMFFGLGVIHRAIGLNHELFDHDHSRNIQGAVGASLVTASLLGRLATGDSAGILQPDKVQVMIDGEIQDRSEFFLMIASSLERLFSRMQPFWGRQAHRSDSRLWFYRGRRTLRSGARTSRRAHGEPHGKVRPQLIGTYRSAAGSTTSSTSNFTTPSMIAPNSPLARLVATELAEEAPPAAQALAEAIRRERENVASILFYGSCLRKKTDEGVFDFYVLVDNYRDTYDSSLLVLGNAILPPNVFYIETEFESRTLRAKYAVLSLSDFEAAVSLLVYQRDDAARDHAIRCAAQAVVTLVQCLMVFLPASGRVQRFSLSALWQQAFAKTYGAERRAESRETIASIYESNSVRYDHIAERVFEVLESEGYIERASGRGGGTAFEIEMSPLRRTMMRWRWHVSRPLARVLAIGRLLKTAFTFGDWVPYAIWKMERHTGEPIELTKRQREHPLIFAWPVIWKVYLRR